MLTPSRSTGAAYRLGREDELVVLCAGRFVRSTNGGRGSKESGNPGESIQRAHVANSKPVKPRWDLRRRVNSLGELTLTSVTVLPSRGPTACNHLCVDALVGTVLRFCRMSNN